MSPTIIKTGRILYAIPVFVFGTLHFMNASAMAVVVPQFIPGGIFWIYLTGAGFIAASVSIIINVQTRLACLLLAGMLLIFILSMHLPNILNSDATVTRMAMTGLLKDFTIAAGALVIAGISGKKIT